jgi:hypothetical protein
MRHLFIIPSIVLALVVSAHAMSVELPVTPTQLNQQNYKFSVSATATNNGTAFHVTITSKKDDIASDSEAKLALVKHPKDRKGTILATSIAPFMSASAITLNKDKKTWTVDFTLPRESLKTPGLCLVFSELAHTPIDGKVIAMPSTTFYEIQLKDFVKE